MRQKTIVNTIKARGRGRDGGETINMRLSPAPENTGIIFRGKTNSGKPIQIRAGLNTATVENNHLVLTDHGQTMADVEHLLATCYAMGVCNLYVDVDGDCLPRLTSSAAGFLFLLRAAGFKEQCAELPQIRFQESLLKKRNNSWVRINSFNGLRVACINTLGESAASVHRSSAVVDVSPAVFVSELSHAQDVADVDISNARFSEQAARNMRNVAQRSQLNHMVVRVLSALSLTYTWFDGCYTAFDADMSLHLSVLRDLTSGSENVDDVDRRDRIRAI
ncbi:MAG: UDP-3-O-acyl-N-acetylglucosamine deacetylase [Gammaproteobacteria bacterium]|nr:UDP-3-O-acyl-N-acetylglucosamine deacetylase [Gammaproteobacteria bacterium]